MTHDYLLPVAVDFDSTEENVRLKTRHVVLEAGSSYLTPYTNIGATFADLGVDPAVDTVNAFWAKIKTYVDGLGH